MKNKKELVFTSDEQKRLFDFLSLVTKHVSEADFKKYSGNISAVLALPSLRTEIARVTTFDTPYDGKLETFKTQAEIWLRTVYMKLEEPKIKMLMALAKSFKKHNEENPENKRVTIDYLLTAMNVEPDTRKYVINKAQERHEKVLREVNFDELNI